MSNLKQMSIEELMELRTQLEVRSDYNAPAIDEIEDEIETRN